MTAPAGRVVGNFVVDDELCAGGMGELLLGMQPSLQRPAVLKRLRRELAANPEYVARFRREACTAAAIHHQNVVAVYDCFSFRGHEYLALEYVDGLDLHRVLQQAGPLRPRLAALIMLEIARGMEAIHARGMVHRDLKPANVLLGRRGEVKVTDFGIALDPAGTQLTQVGFAIGTPPYMSPEQLRGGRVDVRSDIFCMGVVLYEMLAGRPPYVLDGEDGRDTLLGRMKHEDYPPLGRVARSTPRVLRKLAHACLRTRPSRRLASVRALRASLEKHLGRPTTADARAEIADGLWDLSLFEVREGETIITRGHGASAGWITRLQRAAFGLGVAAVSALLTLVLMQQRTLLRGSERQLLEDLATVLPRAWSQLPHPWSPAPAVQAPAAAVSVSAKPAVAPRSPRALATLRFKLHPQARVYVDGIWVGDSLRDSLAVVPGPHLLVIGDPRLGSIEQRVELGVGEDLTYSLMLPSAVADGQ